MNTHLCDVAESLDEHANRSARRGANVVAKGPWRVPQLLLFLTAIKIIK